MRRKPKTVTWMVQREEKSGWYLVCGGGGYELITESGWKYYMRLPALRLGQKAKFKVTVEVVE